MHGPRDLPRGPPYTLGRWLPTAGPTPLRPPIARIAPPWYGTVDPLSIAYGSRPRLRPDSPAADEHGCGTLRLSVGGVRTLHYATHTGIRTRRRSRRGSPGPSPLTTTLPYRAVSRTRGVGGGLSPGTLSAPGHTRPVSYYALFQGWLLLSQPPGCLGARTSLPTEPTLRDLSRRSGLFPSRRRNLAPAVSLRRP